MGGGHGGVFREKILAPSLRKKQSLDVLEEE